MHIASCLYHAHRGQRSIFTLIANSGSLHKFDNSCTARIFSLHGGHERARVKGSDERWCAATVVKVNDTHCLVHFDGFKAKYDEWVLTSSLRSRGTITGAAAASSVDFIGTYLDPSTAVLHTHVS